MLMPATSLAVAVNGGGGAPVIMVHGLGGSSNVFEPLMNALQGWWVIRPDLPGAGRSPLLSGPTTIHTLTDSVIAVAEQFRADHFHLVGHSLGTLICQHVAARKPQTVRSLTLFGPLLEPSETARDGLRTRAQQARAQGMEAIADQILQTALATDSRINQPLVPAFIRELLMRQNPEGYALSCLALAEATAADHSRIECPVLLVTGDEDPIAPPSTATLLADKCRDAKVVIYNRCGHWTPIERPQKCARDLVAFLGVQREYSR
jgi:3-oxoadipate enol-lactonase